MKRILVLNGPNLNMLGMRQPQIYGAQTLADIEALCRTEAARHGLAIDFRQSNHEGDLITWLQEVHEAVAGILINAAAYMHTSIGIYDALCLRSCPIVEVHLSDIAQRYVEGIELIAAKFASKC